MHRIQLPTWTARAKSSSSLSRAVTWLGEPVPAAPRYHLFAPLHYEPNYAYPLLIWLHGPEAHERQLQQVMPLISLRNYVAIGPRATCRQHDDENSYVWGASDSAVAAAEQAILDCLDIASMRMNIHPQRIFLAGFGEGGTMAFRVGLRHPQQFAGVLSLGGEFPSGRGILASLPTLRNLPLFIAHGRDAEGYPLDRLCNDLRLFHAAGLSVTVRQYPCGDELTSRMLHDLDVWMMEHVTGQSQSPSPAATFSAGHLN